MMMTVTMMMYDSDNDDDNYNYDDLIPSSSGSSLHVRRLHLKAGKAIR